MNKIDPAETDIERLVKLGRKIKMQKWREQNKEKINEYQKIWRENNKDKIKESQKKYYIKVALEYLNKK